MLPSILKRGALFWHEQAVHVRTLQFQQLYLPRNAAAIAGETAVRAHNAVARDHERDRIVPHRAADRLRGHFFKSLLSGNLGGNLAVGHGPAIWDRQHDLTDRFAERRGVIAQRRQEIRRTPGEIHIQPALCVRKQRLLLLLGQGCRPPRTRPRTRRRWRRAALCPSAAAHGRRRRTPIPSLP